MLVRELFWPKAKTYKRTLVRSPRTDLLILVFLNFVLQVFNFNSGFFKHGNRVLTVMVAALAYYALYSAVDDEHGAGSARGHAAVEWPRLWKPQSLRPGRSRFARREQS